MVGARRSLFTVALVALALSATASDWSHWRGPEQTGAAVAPALPSEWSPEGLNLLWRAPVGARTAPIVMDGRVYLINRVGEGARTQERVVALDLKTGEPIWEHRFNVFLTDIVAHRVGWANLCGDPATGNIYAHGVQGLFFCFDRDGRILWSRSLTEEFGRISGYGGRTNTPVVDGDLVIISFLNSSWGPQGKGSHRFLAMNKLTGEVAWWSSPSGRPLDTTYSVPVVTTIDGVRTLIAGLADGAVHALSVTTGKPLWSFKLSKRGLNASPVLQGDRVYIGHGEENLDTNAMGRVVCIDAGARNNEGGSREIWRHTGLLAGYASPILVDEMLLVPDHSANLHALDVATGEERWVFNYGAAAKGSGVYADGKVFIGEVGGVYHVLAVSPEGCRRLHSASFTKANGSPIEIFGSPAIVGHRVLLPTMEELYCIGLPREASEEEAVKPTTPSAAEKAGPATQLRVIPAETWLSPGATQVYAAVAYDAKGIRLGPVKATWTAAAVDGAVDADGRFVGAGERLQAGTISAAHGDLAAKARVRVVPGLPYAEDFESLPPGLPPPGWISSKLKCQVVELAGGKVLKKLADRPAPPFARLRAYMMPPLDAGYVVQADMMGATKKRFVPDMGLINCRYKLILLGTTRKPSLRLVTWDPMPRLQKDIEFAWEPGAWYRVRLHVAAMADGTAQVRGKVWPRDDAEPADWTIEMIDPVGNAAGSPGLYAYSVGTTDRSPGTEVFFDNVAITRNP